MTVDLTLLVLNIRVDLPRNIAVNDAFPNVKSTARALWHITEDCVVVSPYQVDDRYVEYVTTILGIDPGRIRIISVESLLWDEILTGTEMEKRIERARRELGGHFVAVESCFQTYGVVELKRRLIGADSSLSEAFMAEEGNQLFNRKTVFRRFAPSQQIPLPEGRCVLGPSALQHAVHELLDVTGTVIVKRDNAYGGLGNFAITAEHERPIHGVAKAYADPSPSRELIDSLYSEMNVETGEPVLVEAYHPFTSAFFFEYYIGLDGYPLLIQSYEMKHRSAGGPDEWWRMDWNGLEMPADLPSDKRNEVVEHSERYFRFAAELGYRGYIHLDGIHLTDGRILFNETNARWSGGTILHKIGSRLKGRGYPKAYLGSYRQLPAVSPAELAAFAAQSPDDVIVACDPDGASETEALVIARSRAAVVAGEARLTEQLTSRSLGV